MLQFDVICYTTKADQQPLFSPHTHFPLHRCGLLSGLSSFCSNLQTKKGDASHSDCVTQKACSSHQSCTVHSNCWDGKREFSETKKQYLLVNYLTILILSLESRQFGGYFNNTLFLWSLFKTWGVFFWKWSNLRILFWKCFKKRTKRISSGYLLVVRACEGSWRRAAAS